MDQGLRGKFSGFDEQASDCTRAHDALNDTKNYVIYSDASKKGVVCVDVAREGHCIRTSTI